MDATVTTYITQLSNGEADTTLAAGFYEDVLGQLDLAELLTTTTSVAKSGTTYTLPDPGVRILLTLYSNVQLGELSVREADFVDPKWRSTAGATPYNFVRESFSQRQQQLVPIPAGNVTFVNTYVQTGSLPAWLQMPVALLCLGMEYRRESNHQNLALASACTSLGQLLIKCVMK